MVRWKEAVQRLLRTYGTEQEITETYDVFNNIPQNDTENKIGYATRINNIAYSYAKVHEKHEKIYLYMKGPLPDLTNILKRLQNAT